MVELLIARWANACSFKRSCPPSLCRDVDPTQLESAILNIAVNARDAMETMPPAADLDAADQPRSPVQSDRRRWRLR
jgi:hypothetical protein